MRIEEFIEVRLAEDEEIARAAGEGPWEIYDRGWMVKIVDKPGLTIAEWEQTKLPETLQWLGDSPNVRHIAQHNPSRTLLEITAKRRALLAFRDKPSGVDVNGMLRWIALQEFVIKPMAAIWQDHPDYQEGWKP